MYSLQSLHQLLDFSILFWLILVALLIQHLTKKLFTTLNIGSHRCGLSGKGLLLIFYLLGPFSAIPPDPSYPLCCMPIFLCTPHIPHILVVSVLTSSMSRQETVSFVTGVFISTFYFFHVLAAACLLDGSFSLLEIIFLFSFFLNIPF